LSSSPLLRISDLSVRYGFHDYSITALDKVSLEIPSSGYTLGIVGESGSGKTTFGMSILDLIEPPGQIEKGSTIEYAGKNILELHGSELRDYRWKQVSMVYQSAMNSLNPVKPVCHPIIEVIRQHTRASKPEATESAVKLLNEVGIDTDRAFDYPHEFSGGMRQRVAIALALALSPRILIADEPTSALDVVVQRQILRLLQREVKAKGLALLFITHELAILPGLVENVAVMHKGRIVEMGPVNKILNEPLHPYTEMLLSTLMTMDSEPDISAGAEVEEGNLVMEQSACQYSNRCKYVFDRCRIEEPQLVQVESGRWVACHKY